MAYLEYPRSYRTYFTRHTLPQIVKSMSGVMDSYSQEEASVKKKDMGDWVEWVMARTESLILSFQKINRGGLPDLHKAIKEYSDEYGESFYRTYVSSAKNVSIELQHAEKISLEIESFWDAYVSARSSLDFVGMSEIDLGSIFTPTAISNVSRLSESNKRTIVALDKLTDLQARGDEILSRLQRGMPVPDDLLGKGIRLAGFGIAALVLVFAIKVVPMFSKKSTPST